MSAPGRCQKQWSRICETEKQYWMLLQKWQCNGQKYDYNLLQCCSSEDLIKWGSTLFKALSRESLDSTTRVMLRFARTLKCRSGFKTFLNMDSSPRHPLVISHFLGRCLLDWVAFRDVKISILPFSLIHRNPSKILHRSWVCQVRHHGDFHLLGPALCCQLWTGASLSSLCHLPFVYHFAQEFFWVLQLIFT